MNANFDRETKSVEIGSVEQAQRILATPGLTRLSAVKVIVGGTAAALLGLFGTAEETDARKRRRRRPRRPIRITVTVVVNNVLVVQVVNTNTNEVESERPWCCLEGHDGPCPNGMTCGSDGLCHS